MIILAGSISYSGAGTSTWLTIASGFPAPKNTISLNLYGNNGRNAARIDTNGNLQVYNSSGVVISFSSFNAVYNKA